MQRISSALFLAWFVFCPLANCFGLDAGVPSPETYHPRRIMVKRAEGIAGEGLKEFIRTNGCSVIGTFQGVNSLQLVQIPEGATVNEFVTLFRRSKLVEYAEPDFIIRSSLEPNDQGFIDGSSWHLKNLGQSGGVAGADIWAVPAWDIRTSASNVVVAIVDSGVRLTHQDLKANIWTNSGEIPANGLDDDTNGIIDDVHGLNAITQTGDPTDEYGHGTQVAGVLGCMGNNGVGGAGVAWSVQIMACRYQDRNGVGYTSDVIKCLDYARNKGAHIINASFSSTRFSSGLYDAMKACRNSGIIVVAAAGNDGYNTDVIPSYPACFDLENIVAVAASTRTDDLAGFSNYGRDIDLVAPGSDIFTSSSESDSSYATVSGTSFSAPIISGVIALLRSEYPAETYDQLINRLCAGVTLLPQLSGKCSTGGRVNLAESLALPSVAGFNVSSRIGAVPFTVVFTNTSVGTITNWGWSFGDGTQSHEPAPSHTYTNQGTFEVTLTSTDSEGRSSVKRSTINSVFNYSIADAPYNWVETSGMTPISIDCFSVSPAQDLPFAFSFYGSNYTQVYIGDSGLIGFDPFSFQPSTDLPSTAFPNNIVCPFWDLFTPCTSGQIFAGTVGQAPDRKYVVSWVGVARLFNDQQPFTFQVVLEETSNRILFQYKQVQNGSVEEGALGAAATIGLEHRSGQVAAKYSFVGSALVTNNQAIAFIPGPVASGAMEVTPATLVRARGHVDGPFAPQSIVYSITNISTGPVEWSASSLSPWIRLETTNGVLQAGGSLPVGASLVNNPEIVEGGTNLAEITFSCDSTGQTVTRTVALERYPLIMLGMAYEPIDQIVGGALSGVPGCSYVVERSHSLTNWESVMTNSATQSGFMEFSDAWNGLTNYFYRVRWQP